MLTWMARFGAADLVGGDSAGGDASCCGAAPSCRLAASLVAWEAEVQLSLSHKWHPLQDLPRLRVAVRSENSSAIFETCLRQRLRAQLRMSCQMNTAPPGALPNDKHLRSKPGQIRQVR